MQIKKLNLILPLLTILLLLGSCGEKFTSVEKDGYVPLSAKLVEVELKKLGLK